MTEKELNKLFSEKLKGQSFPFNEKAWESMEQMLDPQEPLSEMEYRKLFQDKLATASFAFNPANWSKMETQLNEKQGAMSEAEVKALFETKLKSQSFAFNPANWERMEAILDGEPKKGLVYFWRSAAAILLFAASTLAFQFIGQPQLSNTQNIESISASPTGNSAQENVAPQIAPKSLENGTLVPSKSSGSSGAAKVPPAAPSTNNLAAKQGPERSNTIIGANDALLTDKTKAELFTAAEIKDFTKRGWKNLPAITNSLGFRIPPSSSIATTLIPEKAVYVPRSFSKISLQAGPSVNPGYNGKTGTGFFAGLEYEYGFNEHLSLSAGLMYNYGGDMGIESISDSTFFGLARTDVETHNHYKNRRSIRMPVSLNIKVHPKHSFSVGAYADALIAVSMEQQKTTTIFKQDPKVEHSSGDAPKNGFTSYSGGASFAYTYHYSERLSIGLNQQYGFVDLTNDQHQNFKKHHQTSQTNLVLKFSIWQR